MKKFLLSLVALLGVSTYALADVENATDLSTYDDVVYFQNIEVLQGTTTVALPIYINSHAIFVAYDFNIQLPEDAQLKKLNDVYLSRYDKDYDGFQSIVHAGNDQPDGSYKIAGSIISGGTVGGVEYESKAFNAGDAEFCSVNVDVSSLQPGEYELTIKAGSQISGFYDGKPDAVIAEDIVTTLTIVNYLTLDENSKTAPEAYEGNVLLNRTINENQWSTICLPLDLSASQLKETFGPDVKLAKMTSWSYEEDDDFDIKSITAEFTSCDALEKHVPYLIKVSTPFKSKKIENVTIDDTESDPVLPVKVKGVGQANVYGTYVAETEIPEDYLFINNNNFYYSTGNTLSKAFRAYFQFRGVTLGDAYKNIVSPSVKMSFDVDGETTVVEGINVNSEGAIYTIDGKFVGRDVDVKKLQKGIYIIDGKKIMVK